jgi:hypothetical protein
MERGTIIAAKNRKWLNWKMAFGLPKNWLISTTIVHYVPPFCAKLILVQLIIVIDCSRLWPARSGSGGHLCGVGTLKFDSPQENLLKLINIVPNNMEFSFATLTSDIGNDTIKAFTS